MDVEIREDTSERIERTAEALGIEKKELVDRAILLYLDTIDKYAELKEEMKMWDRLSDEALANFEKSL